MPVALPVAIAPLSGEANGFKDVPISGGGR